MKRFLTTLLVCSLLLGGCRNIATKVKPMEDSRQTVEWREQAVGRIGDDFSITRAQAAKMMALAFYSQKELEELPKTQVFADVADDAWYSYYVNGAVEQGFLAGDDTGFHPDEPLTLQQTQYLLERLHPEHRTKINVTEETKDKPVSYSLWVQIFEDALMQRRGEDSLYSYGMVKENITLLQNAEKKLLGAKGSYTALGYDMSPYFYTEITAFCKDGEMVALLEVADTSPLLSNVYYRASGDEVFVETGAGEARLNWGHSDAAKESPLYQKDAEGIGQVQLLEGKVEGITAVPNIGKVAIKKVDANQIELEGLGSIPWAKDAGIYEQTEKGYRRRPAARLVCGTALADFYESNGEINGAVIREMPPCENIRVLLSNTGQKGYIQPGVTLSSDTGFILSNDKEQKIYAADQTIVLQDNPEAMSLFQTGRIYAQARDNGLLRIESITKNAVHPQYGGRIEIEQVDGGFRLINELPLEQYLSGVVPGEMPVSFGLEALKVQAVAARSYAYNQFYANRYGEQGAHVDDTTLTQVYVGAPGDPLSDQAIAETEGECLTYDKTVVIANFYSSTCGYSADAGDVWRGDGGKTFPGDGKPYLKSKGQGLREDFGDVSVEQNASAFLKTQDISCYDSDSPYVRWKTVIPGADLTALINKGAAELWEQKTGVIQLKEGEQWVTNGTLPVFGAIHDIAVTKRGDGGIAMIVEVTADAGSIRILTEYAVRKVLRPAKPGDGEDIILQLHDGSERANMNLLPSAFIAFEKQKDENGNLASLTIYGGGNGHGAGMSQYGARGMALQGYSYKEILAHYFEGGKAEKVIP